jgi:hypothetical protein
MTGRGTAERALTGRMGIGLSSGAGFGRPLANTGSGGEAWSGRTVWATGGGSGGVAG